MSASRVRWVMAALVLAIAPATLISSGVGQSDRAVAHGRQNRCVQPRVHTPQPGGREIPPALTAVSLAVVQRDLAACRQGLPCDRALLTFDGLTRIEGYVVDAAAHDVILYGTAEPRDVPLHLEDFLVALRNAWNVYATVRGNTITYAYPSVTIDPRRATLLELDAIGDRMNQARGEKDRDRAIDDWHAACRTEQDVTSMGVPSDSRFASVMYTADYLMKSIVDGSVDLEMPDHLKSVTKMTLEQAEQDIVDGRDVSIRIGGLTRFWFYPGDYRLQRSDDALHVVRCPVILCAEPEAITASGQAVASSRTDPITEAFAANFTTAYPEVAKRETIYTELEDLFRFVLIAKAMRVLDPFAQAGMSREELLHGMDTVAVKVPPTTKGVSTIGTFEHRDRQGNTIRTISLRLPSCGGVAMEIDVEPSTFVAGDPQQLEALRRAIIAARPGPEARSWPVRWREAVAPLVSKPAVPAAGAVAAGGAQPRRPRDEAIAGDGEELEPLRALLAAEPFTEELVERLRRVDEVSMKVRAYSVEPYADATAVAVLYDPGAGERFAIVDAQGIKVVADGAEARSRFNEVGRSSCVRRSGERARFVHVSQEGDDLVFQVGDAQERFLGSEVAAIVADGDAGGVATIALMQTGPAADRLRRLFGPGRFILYRDGRAVMRGGAQSDSPLEDPLAWSLALTRLFAGAPEPPTFFVDDEMRRAIGNLDVLATMTLAAPDDLTVVIPEQGFAVKDFGFYTTASDIFEQERVPVLRSDQLRPLQPTERDTTLVISAHNEDQLHQFLSHLGQQDKLRNRLLILQTCCARSSPNRVRALIQKHGALGVLYYAGTAGPDVLPELWWHMLQILKDAPRPFAPDELLRRAVERAISQPGRDGRPPPTPASQLEKLQAVIYQISAIAPALRPAG